VPQCEWSVVRERSANLTLLKRLALDKLHNQEVDAVLMADVEVQMFGCDSFEMARASRSSRRLCQLRRVTSDTA
jgi:hypothetical protein